ncbi:beta-1,3-N-acetylglucosaminyltransferase radical fringe-like [Mytilus trossulus]|uniref:beta-1,3-N-acetylglucosaminyltransferase radical fringe-like n=1 Tax=Mytilus trossulus TaxID=6551 RepID=UPI0030056B4F
MNCNVSECRKTHVNICGKVMRISLRRICKLFLVIVTFILALLLISITNTEHIQTKQIVFTKFVKRSYRRQLSLQKEQQVVDHIKFQRKTNGVNSAADDENLGKDEIVNKNGKIRQNRVKNVMRKTVQSDIFISVKTTKSNRNSRLDLLMETWIPLAKDETYIFTDNDSHIPENFHADHFINTFCADSHYRQGLCCKMAREYDLFIESKKRWFCHVDDDNYVNVPALVGFLQQYNHSDNWYLGRPSISHPMEVLDRANPGQKLAFWFATGGAGFCISRGLADNMVPHAGGGRIQTTGDAIRLPDDCTVGYIINHLLKVPLTKIKEFHSHLEGLHRIPQHQLSDQLTLSYFNSNVIDVKGYSHEKDPTRFRTVHCHLYPYLTQCVDMPRW